MLKPSKNVIATTLQAVGSSIVGVSLSLVALPLGLGFAGIALIAFGIATERS